MKWNEKGTQSVHFLQLHSRERSVKLSKLLQFKSIYFHSLQILLQKLFCPTARKVTQKNFWNLRLKAENFQNFWDHLNNLFKQWIFRTIFGNRMLVLGDFSDLKKKNNYNSNWKKLLGFRNLQEKLEKAFCYWKINI